MSDAPDVYQLRRFLGFARGATVLAWAVATGMCVYWLGHDDVPLGFGLPLTLLAVVLFVLALGLHAARQDVGRLIAFQEHLVRRSHAVELPPGTTAVRVELHFRPREIRTLN